MQFFTVAALLSSVVAASEFTSSTPNTLPELFARIPSCANSCIADAMPGLCPSVESYWCRCHNSVKGRLLSKTFDCAMEACGGMQQALEYQEAANSVCDDIMEVTIKSQKHIELRAVGSGSVSGSAMGSGSVMAGSGGMSVRPTGSTMRRGGSARGSAAGSGSATAVATIAPSSSTPAAASGAASALTAASGKSGLILASGFVGFAAISFFGMLV